MSGLMGPNGAPLAAAQIMPIQEIHTSRPKAQPSCIAGMTPNGPEVKIIDGLTKLEWMAGMVAAGGRIADPASIAEEAEDILAACKAE